MKKHLFNNAIVAFLLTLLIASCTTSQDVASNNWIQKRKYTKGYHIEKASKFKHDIVKPEEQQLAENTAAPVENTTEFTNTTPAVAPTVVTAEPVAMVPTAKKERHTNKASAKLFAKAKEHKEISRNEFKNYREYDASTVGSITPLGTTAVKELNPYLKKALIAAVIALVLQIIAVAMVAGSAAKTVSGSGTGAGIGAGVVVAWIAYIFWIIAVVFFVLWLIDMLK